MKCPECGHTNKFKYQCIALTRETHVVHKEMSTNGKGVLYDIDNVEENDGIDLFMKESDLCTCLACNHQDTMADFEDENMPLQYKELIPHFLGGKE